MAERGRADAPVAVVAATEAEAVAAARVLGRRFRGVVLAPASLDGYLGAPEAPGRVVLCVTGRSVSRIRAFLRRAAERLLWPSPPSDLLDAVAGLRHVPVAPRRGTRAAPAQGSAQPRTALLLEGPVDARRARAALRSTPREWIVESARHVRVGPRALAALARAGVAWSALDPVELVAICAEAPLPPESGVPAGVPVWIPARSRA